jgi:indolepyruvate ferredoxin oxidoreductase beta subunit
MTKNIIIAGVGGQGILTIASIIDLAAMHTGLFVKQAEVHGMSQRGGEVQSHLRISDTEIFSDLIPLGKADIIISVEPLEALRYVPFLSENGVIITATESVMNIANYPDYDSIIQGLNQSAHTILINATEIAQSLGNAKSYNIVMLGAAIPYIGIDIKQLEWGIQTLFSTKGQEIIDMNIAALHQGLKITQESVK